jgi:L-2-hydroxyglutarate oxidase LhgO
MFVETSRTWITTVHPSPTFKIPGNLVVGSSAAKKHYSGEPSIRDQTMSNATAVQVITCLSHFMVHHTFILKQQHHWFIITSAWLLILIYKGVKNKVAWITLLNHHKNKWVTTAFGKREPMLKAADKKGIHTTIQTKSWTTANWKKCNAKSCSSVSQLTHTAIHPSFKSLAKTLGMNQAKDFILNPHAS